MLKRAHPPLRGACPSNGESAVGAVCDRAYFVDSVKGRAVIDRAYSGRRRVVSKFKQNKECYANIQGGYATFYKPLLMLRPIGLALRARLRCRGTDLLIEAQPPSFERRGMGAQPHQFIHPQFLNRSLSMAYLRTL